MTPYFQNAHGELYHGDCLEVMGGMNGCAFDMVITSPPYDNLRTYNGYTFDFERTAQGITGLMKKGAVCVWVVGDATVKGSETGSSFRQALYFKDVCGLNLHDTMVWQKPDSKPLTHNRYEQSFEYMFVLSHGRPFVFNGIKDKENKSRGRLFNGTWRDTDGTLKRMSGHNKKEIGSFGLRRNVWDIPTEKGCGKFGHPAPFPPRLASDHITSWTNPGDTVFDPMMGSGTTAVAAQALGRKWVGCEISEEYCEIIAKRLENME
jgi:DNA modification methylase